MSETGSQPNTNAEPPPPRERLSALQIAGLIGVIALVGYLLARFEVLGLESVIWEEAAAFHPGGEDDLSRIVIVAISQDEYEHDFNAQSPLNPAKLIQDLISIAHAGPKLIAVDIDTSHPKYAHLTGSRPRASARLWAEVPHWHEKFVWARPAAIAHGDAYMPEAVLGEDAPPRFPALE